MTEHILYHDSVSCDTDTNEYRIHTEHVSDEERIGQPFSPAMEPVPMNITTMNIQCK